MTWRLKKKIILTIIEDALTEPSSDHGSGYRGKPLGYRGNRPYRWGSEFWLPRKLIKFKFKV